MTPTESDLQFLYRIGATDQAPANGKRPALPPFQVARGLVPEPVSWVADGFLLADETSMLAGEGGSMKTTLMLTIAAAIAGGYPVLGAFPTAGPSAVALCSEEDGLDVLLDRLHALTRGLGWDLDLVAGNLHLLALEGALIGDLEWQLHLEAECQRLGSPLLCLDPLADMLGGDENDNSYARGVVQWFRRLNRQGTAILLCHHYKKPGQHTPASPRGASAWLNACRAVYTVEEKDGSRWLGCGKANRFPKPPARELTVTIAADPANAASWQTAEVRLAHPPGTYAITDRDLTPAERTALTSIERHAGEGLSWSKWKDVSGLSSNGLSLVKRRLQSLQLVAATESGKRMGKPVFSYDITEKGKNSLCDYPTTPDYPPTTQVVHSHDYPTTRPLIRGGIRGVGSLPIASEIASLTGSEDFPGFDPEIPVDDAPNWEPDDHGE
jgi:calcineurin-like phosphoesterase family protein